MLLSWTTVANQPVKIPFTSGQDPEDLKQKIKKLRRGVVGILEEGIKLVADELFSPKHGSRPTAMKSLVIITNNADLPEAESEKKKLQKKGVKVVVLGLGENVKPKKAKKLASTPDLVELVESLEENPKVVDELVEKVTQGTAQGDNRIFLFCLPFTASY